MSNDLISRKEAERFLRAYADEVGCNRGEYELANGILKAACFLSENENVPAVYDADEVALAMEKQDPYKITYKNGFGHCKCGCEFEREGYEAEEYCPECGQKVWVGGYKGEEYKIVSFAEVEHGQIQT